jgi:hypothetical protein
LFNVFLQYFDLDRIHPGNDITIRDVPVEIVNEALKVLYNALSSENIEKRFKAAVEALPYVK